MTASSQTQSAGPSSNADQLEIMRTIVSSILEEKGIGAGGANISQLRLELESKSKASENLQKAAIGMSILALIGTTTTAVLQYRRNRAGVPAAQ